MTLKEAQEAYRKDKPVVYLDVTNSGLDDATIDQQIEKLFNRSDTDRLEEVVIIRGDTIFRIAKRA